MHQSSRNSGVIHSGIYYTPGTLKAKLCVKGLDMTYAYCRENNIPFKKCGKVLFITTSIANAATMPELHVSTTTTMTHYGHIYSSYGSLE